MTQTTAERSFPELPANTTLAEEYVTARHQYWVAQSPRGLEVLRYRQGFELLDHPGLEKGPAWLQRLDDIGLTSGPAREYWERQLLTSEGARREHMRAPMAQLFRPAQMAKLQKAMRAIIDETLDGIEDPTDVDFMQQIAWKIPPMVYCHLISAPMELAAEVAHISDTIVQPILTGDKSRLQASIDALWTAYAFNEKHIEARRGNLGDDFTSALIRLQMEGVIPADEVTLHGMTILQASIDNTVHQLGLTFGTLLEDRRRWEQLLAQPSLVGPAAEETYRLRPRFGTIMRYAREAVAYEDIVIPADSWIYVSVRSAGRDEEKFDDADLFRLGRPPARALMFGNGPYDCLGMTLVRLEIGELLKAVIKRFPGIRMLGEWRTFDTNAVSETAHLRVALA
ncbi:cytochrome P450 [Rhizorhabdus argentea]|uniref:cytochrome P450 n=1 Tax=Rhizorhabdus argentea TaxID=1387174 RepID=UPI0030EEADA4